MRGGRTAGWMVGIAALGTAHAAAQAAPDPLARAAARGTALSRYDRAAWVASDALAAKLPRKQWKDLGGWIVSPAGDRLRVDFFGAGALAGRSLFSVEVDARGKLASAEVYPADAAPALSPLAARMAAALLAARAELPRHPDWRPCTPSPFNTVVLPPGDDGIVAVYFLSAQTERGKIPFGGHYTIDVRADGTIAGARAFAKACLTADASAAGPGGAQPAALTIGHLLDPQPTEVHVLQQLALGIPLIVATGSGALWRVEGGRIARLPGK